MARFGEQFKDKIANRHNFLHFWRRSPEAVKAKEKRMGIAQSKESKDYVFAYVHEAEGQNIDLFNMVDKILTQNKQACPHVAIDP